MSIAAKNKVVTDETRRKIGEATKKRFERERMERERLKENQ